MMSCWEKDPKNRPKFSNLVIVLSGMLEKEAGYLKISESLNQNLIIQTEEEGNTVEVEKIKEIHEDLHNETILQ